MGNLAGVENLLAPIISTIILILVGIIGYIVFTKVTAREKEKAKSEERGESAQDFTNVLDIDADNSILYTADGNILSIIRIEPVSLDLMSDAEKKTTAEALTAAIGKYGGSFKFIAVSRPVDTKPLIDKYNDMYTQAESDVRKKLLKNAARTMEALSLGGEVTERQFYFIIWENYKDNMSIGSFLKKRGLFVSSLNEARARLTVAGKPEMIRVCNLYFNPSALSYEIYDDEEIGVTFLKA